MSRCQGQDGVLSLALGGSCLHTHQSWKRPAKSPGQNPRFIDGNTQAEAGQGLRQVHQLCHVCTESKELHRPDNLRSHPGVQPLPPLQPSASPASPSSRASRLGLPPQVQGGGPSKQGRKSEPGLLTGISQHPRASPLSMWASWKAAAGPEAATRWQALHALL